MVGNSTLQQHIHTRYLSRLELTSLFCPGLMTSHAIRACVDPHSVQVGPGRKERLIPSEQPQETLETLNLNLSRRPKAGETT